jgi:transcriptional regulator with XRE-family HTH domain
MYTSSLQMSTASSLPERSALGETQPVVDGNTKRVAPALSPDDYQTLAKWLEAATERRGMASELARFCGVERQNVTKWLNGSIPDGPLVKKLISDWAQVDYYQLRDLIDRDEEARKEAPKKATASSALGKRTSARRARSRF